MKLKIRLCTSMIGLAAGLACASGASAAPRTCSLEAIKAIAPPDAVIDSVKPIAAPVAHCEVLGHITTTNPGPGHVEFSVLLPDQRFNNRFYFVGEGAAAGFVPTATLSDPANAGYLNTTLKLLGEGFVVAGTDTGHKGMMWDFGIGNPVARLDHGHRGAHVSTVAAQAITRAYYRMQDKLYRYHLGCSGGGRMGSMAITYHPEDYDGAVVSTGFQGGGSIWFAWILQNLLRDPNGWLSPQKLAFLERKVGEACAGPDGLVRDPNACGFEPAKLLCKPGDGDDCLTAPELHMVKVITGRYPSETGKTGRGFTLASPTSWSSFLLGNTRPTNTDPNNPWAPGAAPPSFPIMQSILRGMYFDDAKFDFVKDLDFNNPAHLERLRLGHPTWGAGNPDLAAFKRAGGKLILWAGLAENAVPPATETDYYDWLKTADPNADDFVRVYLTPGVNHCAGGQGPQDTPDRLLDKVIAWRELGRRPDAVVVTGPTPRLTPPAPGAPPTLPAPPFARTVLLCPYPQMARFKGPRGAFAYDAENWTCSNR